MRLIIHLLCVTLSISFVLAPLSRVHAHVGVHEQVSVHGGHNHDATGDHTHHHDAHHEDHHRAKVAEAHEHGPIHDPHAYEAVVDLKTELSQGSPQVLKSIHWIAAFLVVVLTVLQLRQIGSLLRPPRTRSRPSSPYPHALPLLRGPPHSI